MLWRIAGLVLVVAACVLQVRERLFIQECTQTVGFLSGWDEGENDEGDPVYTGVVTYYAGRTRLNTRLKVTSSWRGGELGTPHPVRYRTDSPNEATLGDLWLILTMLGGLAGLSMLVLPTVKVVAAKARVVGIPFLPGAFVGAASYAIAAWLLARETPTFWVAVSVGGGGALIGLVLIGLADKKRAFDGRTLGTAFIVGGLSSLAIIGLAPALASGALVTTGAVGLGVSLVVSLWTSRLSAARMALQDALDVSRGSGSSSNTRWLVIRKGDGYVRRDDEVDTEFESEITLPKGNHLILDPEFEMRAENESYRESERTLTLVAGRPMDSSVAGAFFRVMVLGVAMPAIILMLSGVLAFGATPPKVPTIAETPRIDTQRISLARADATERCSLLAWPNEGPLNCKISLQCGLLNVDASGRCEQDIDGRLEFAEGVFFKTARGRMLRLDDGVVRVRTNSDYTTLRVPDDDAAESPLAP